MTSSLTGTDNSKLAAQFSTRAADVAGVAGVACKAVMASIVTGVGEQTATLRLGKASMSIVDRSTFGRSAIISSRVHAVSYEIHGVAWAQIHFTSYSQLIGMQTSMDESCFFFQFWLQFEKKIEFRKCSFKLLKNLLKVMLIEESNFKAVLSL